MVRLKRSLVPFVIVLLLVPAFLAQGPKKDIGISVPLSREVPLDRDEKPPQKPDLPKADTIALDVDLVNVDFTVTDSDGNPVHDLREDQFKVFDDNVEQQITHFSTSHSPITVTVLMEFGATIAFRRLLQGPAQTRLLRT
jgi:hypothetical protein